MVVRFGLYRSVEHVGSGCLIVKSPGMVRETITGAWEMEENEGDAP